MNFAIIKQGGLCAGGIEKYLQHITKILIGSGHSVTYFYTDAVTCGPSNWMHPGTDPTRKKYVEDLGAKLVEVSCSHIVALEQGGEWLNTDFWDLFKEEDYDVVIGGHKGEPCWPFSQIKNTGIVETVHGTAFTSGVSKYADAYILISEIQNQKWFNLGGIADKTHNIYPAVGIPEFKKCQRSKYGIPKDKFIYGMHQSNRQGLWSPIPLNAYKAIETDDTCFVLLGGEEAYVQQANRIGLKNFIRVPFASTSEGVHEVLSCLDVYTHGRSDGEVCSSAIIEAMYHGLPIVTHKSGINNGHLYQINGCGFLGDNIEQYASNMYSLFSNKQLYDESSQKTKQAYSEKFNFVEIEKRILHVLENVGKSNKGNK
jgi:glycosyltransferase involved in cell wall biosynthesis